MDKQYDFFFNFLFISSEKKGEKDSSRVHGRCLSCVAGLLGQQN